MSDSDDDSDIENVQPVQGGFVSTTPLGQPFMRFQGAYLPNLLKLLNEAEHTGLITVIRWHPKISNALQINWKLLHTDFENVHPILVQYKVSRATNQKSCVRPTINRKLREWNFKMVCDGNSWVTYIYETAMFCKDGLYASLPVARRKRREASTDTGSG